MIQRNLLYLLVYNDQSAPFGFGRDPSLPENRLLVWGLQMGRRSVWDRILRSNGSGFGIKIRA